MSSGRGSPLEDRLAEGSRGEHASLAMGRGRARTLLEIARDLRGLDLTADRASVVADALVRVQGALEASFPENLFLDLDLFAATIARLPAAADVDRSADIVCRLSAVFGGPPIRFRYTHDFLYGFDWCRWVAKEPGARAAVGPFDLPFLEYSLARAGELVELIAAGDAKYGPIDPGTYRNPFGFSREPDEERTLHVALAARDLLPVEAFSIDGRARWDRPFATLREDVAAELGMRRRASGPP